MFSRLPLNLVIAFNGSAEHRGFKDLEVMAFNPKTDAFDILRNQRSDIKIGSSSSPQSSKMFGVSPKPSAQSVCENTK